ncbi:DUF4861 family protein [Sinomicrobium sp.]
MKTKPMKKKNNTTCIKDVLKSCGLAVAVSALLFSCNTVEKAPELSVEVANQLDFKRTEVVAIPVSELSVFDGTDKKHLRLRKDGEEANIRTQWIDYNQDGIADEWLFQADVPASGTAKYTAVVDSVNPEPESDVIAYSRFVPERTDDYTWENDKVAFRVYGPTGQREALAGVAGSTLSSGVDIWLKRTDKSVIDKWYGEHVKTPGYYHIDHGEGYDPYHVGDSRGTGGTGIWENDSLYVSENYVSYNTIAAGPLRTVFELKYEPWSDYGVEETKKVTLDLGSNFSKFDISLYATKDIPNYAVGITLHKNEGEHKINTEEGWFRYWETIDSTKVGEGIVMAPTIIDSAFARQSEVPDQSNLIVLTKPGDEATFYAGFAWEKSGQVSSVEEWDAMLKRQAEVIAAPLVVSVKSGAN